MSSATIIRNQQVLVYLQKQYPKFVTVEALSHELKVNLKAASEQAFLLQLIEHPRVERVPNGIRYKPELPIHDAVSLADYLRHQYPAGTRMTTITQCYREAERDLQRLVTNKCALLLENEEKKEVYVYAKPLVSMSPVSEDIKRIWKRAGQKINDRVASVTIEPLVPTRVKKCSEKRKSVNVNQMTNQHLLDQDEYQFLLGRPVGQHK